MDKSCRNLIRAKTNAKVLQAIHFQLQFRSEFGKHLSGETGTLRNVLIQLSIAGGQQFVRLLQVFLGKETS